MSVTTLSEFGPKFHRDYAEANRQKPSGIALNEERTLDITSSLAGQLQPQVTPRACDRLRVYGPEIPVRRPGLHRSLEGQGSKENGSPNGN